MRPQGLSLGPLHHITSFSVLDLSQKASMQWNNCVQSIPLLSAQSKYSVLILALTTLSTRLLES